MSLPAPHQDYRPDVDGLRAISVVGVILFHTGLGFPGGYVGVDVFLVISGFLITRIIQNAIEKKGFTLAGFWARRVRRILPASMAITLFTLLAGCVIFLPYDLHELAEAAFGHGVFASNFYHWFQLRDYFAREAELRPLLHTWSLAVEEQFYFLYPFLLLSLRNTGRQPRLLILAGIAAVSLGLSVFGVRWFPQAAFFLLPTRAWELLVGALIALCGRPTNLSRLQSQIISCAGLGLILAAMLFYTGKTHFPGYAAVLPVAGAGLLIIGNSSPNNLVCRLLSFRPIVFTGLLSYSLYLWHWPLLVFAKYIAGSVLSAPMLAGVLCSTLILSLLSWRFIELPFRKSGVKWRPPTVIATGGAVTMAICVCALIMRQSGGLPGRFAGQKLATEDAGFANSTFFRGRASDVPSALPAIGCAGTNCLPARVVLWGDSHSTPVVAALDGVFKQVGIPCLVAARSASAPIIETKGKDSEASQWNNAVLSYLATGDVSAVIIVSRWSTWLKNDAAFESVQERLTRLVEKGVQVYLMQQVPEQSFNVSRAIHDSKFGMSIPSGCTLAEHLARQSTANAYLQRLQSASIHLLDPTPFCFDEADVAKIGEKNRAYYRDDDHLSSYGAVKLLSPLFRDVAAAVASGSPAHQAGNRSTTSSF